MTLCHIFWRNVLSQHIVARSPSITNGISEDISQLTARVAERGVDLQTERKVDQWKQEVMAQMQLMQSQVSLNKQTNLMHGDNQTTAMLKELQSL